MRMAFAPLLAVSLLLGACASGPTYRTDYDPSVDFSSYETYGFFAPLGTDRAGYSTLITQHFKAAVRREMDALGYRFVEAGEPDLLVNFSANAEEVTEVRSRPAPTLVATYGYYGYRRGLYTTFPMYTTEVDTVRYQEGTANVDVIDNRANRLVWEGVVEGRLSREAMENPKAAIDRVVGELFARYPTAPQPAE